MKKQIINTCVIIALNIMASTAQTEQTSQTAHEFSIFGGGGLSTLNYQLSSGDATRGAGGDFGVGYAYFFGSQLGIRTGVGIALYNAKTGHDGIKTVITNLADSEGARFDLHTTLDNYSETQKTTYLNIPIMAQFQTDDKQGFCAAGGFKIGIPLSSKYSSSSATLTNAGYYPEPDNWATVQEFAGYGVFAGRKFTGNLDLGVSVMLALEAGMKWDLGANFSLYTGAYFDYGLNSVAKNGSAPFVNYAAENASDFTTNSILPQITRKVNIMAAGITVRLGMNL